jgi:hypothetical protein
MRKAFGTKGILPIIGTLDGPGGRFGWRCNLKNTTFITAKIRQSTANKKMGMEPAGSNTGCITIF